MTPKLEFLYRWNGAHVFKWRSKYACPDVSVLPGDSKEEPGNSNDEEETLPPIDSEPDGDHTVPRSQPSPWYIGFAIFLFVACDRMPQCRWLTASATSFVAVSNAILPRKYRNRILRLRAYVPDGLLRRPKESEYLLGERGTERGSSGTYGRTSASPKGQKCII